LLTLGAILALCAPCLVFGYLPCTDLPQHLSVASILQNHGDPAYDFARHYDIDLGRTMYLLPYGLTLLLGLALPLPLALACVVFLSVVGYPLALMRLLRALGKPRALCLIGAPLVYNSAFYWGFINFNLGMALSIWGMALLLEPRRGWRGDVALAVLGGLIVFTHLYGLALLLGFGAIVLVLGPGEDRWRRLLPLIPALVGAVIWPRPGAGINPDQVASWVGAAYRLPALPRQVFGAYQDRAELLLMGTMLAVFALLWALGRAPGRPSLRRMPWAERALWLTVALNLCLYQLMPLHTATAKYVHFRHALIAAMLLPALAPSGALRQGGRAARLALAAAALLAIASAWYHLGRFDRETRDFQQVLEKIPPRPRLLSILGDARGQVMASSPYLHFAAHVQARRGGLIATTFARFWNIPVRRRAGGKTPDTPESFEWLPRAYDYRKFGYHYPWVLVRGPLPRLEEFPYRLVHGEGAWRLFKKDKSLIRRPAKAQ